jgi:hypothetical protein
LGVGTSGRAKDIRKGYRRVNAEEYYAFMFKNGKIRYVETIPEMHRGGINENYGRGEFNQIYFKNF